MINPKSFWDASDHSWESATTAIALQLGVDKRLTINDLDSEQWFEAVYREIERLQILNDIARQPK